MQGVKGFPPGLFVSFSVLDRVAPLGLGYVCVLFPGFRAAPSNLGYAVFVPTALSCRTAMEEMDGLDKMDRGTE